MRELDIAQRSIIIAGPGAHGGEVTPVPIPNTEVKLTSADDTAEGNPVGK